jgi:hypothetical protein
MSIYKKSLVKLGGNLMKRTARIWISNLIVFSLVFSLFPPQERVEANTGSNPIVISDPIGDADSPTQVSASRIDVKGSFFGVSNLSYTVSQYRKLSNGELVLIQSREGVERPQIDGSKFTFVGVELYEGINMITVKGSQDGQVYADRKYVELTNLPVIKSVKYNEQDLQKNNEIKDKLFNDELTIKGGIINATDIVATVNGGSQKYVGSTFSSQTEDEDTYIITKIPLQRGKNTIELVAKNLSKTYPLEVVVIYNDGAPYIDGELEANELVSPMTFVNNELRITGNMYNFKATPDNGQTSDDQIDIEVNGSILSMTRTEFHDLPGGGSKTENGITLTKSGETVVDGVYTYDYEIYVPAIKENDINNLKVTFTRGGQSYVQKYSLEHLDPSVVYITQTSGLASTVTSKNISFSLTTSAAVINESQFVTHQYVDEAGNTQTIYLPINTIETNVDGTVTYTFVDVPLSPGPNTLIARPNDNDTNKRDYFIQYINSPDVKIYNLVNGDKIGGDNGQNPILYGELVNIDLNDRERTTITIENGAGAESFRLQLSDFFTDPGQEFEFVFDLEATNRLNSGANDITIRVSDGATTTETRLTVFYFNSDTPAVTVDVDPEEKVFSTDTFKKVSSGNYETEAHYVFLEMTYGGASELIFYYNGVQAAYLDVSDPANKTIRYLIDDPVIRLEFDGDSTIKTNYPLYLNRGTNTFELEGISSFGTSSNSKVSVTRYQSPVRLIQPVLPRENVVNQNFIKVVVEADADIVKIGRDEATLELLEMDELRELLLLLPVELRSDILQKYNVDDINDDDQLQRVDQSEVAGKRFVAEVFLKPGKNTIKYSVEKGGNKSKHEFEIFYAESPTEGARYKESLSRGKIDVFDDGLEIDFPRNTLLVDPNSDSAVFDVFEHDVDVSFGIVDRSSGKLVKVWSEQQGQYIFEEFQEPFRTIMPFRFIPPDRTGYAGQIYWIEAAGDMTNVNSGLIPSNRGEITIAYNQSIRNDAQNLLAVYRFDPDEQRWTNLGGVVDTRKQTITAPVEEFGYYTVMAKRGTYNDIRNHSWAANYLQTMFAKGIMKAESFNRFGSDLLTTRGEFSTLLVKALQIPINAGPYLDKEKTRPVNPTFVDVNPLLDPQGEFAFYSYEYIETAGRAGIVRGLGQGEFGPEGLLTREEAAIMIARALNLDIEDDIDRSMEKLRKDYADADKISRYAVAYVQAVINEGIMSGSPFGDSDLMNFNPDSFLSRAEAAAVAYRLMQEQKLLP